MTSLQALYKLTTEIIQVTLYMSVHSAMEYQQATYFGLGIWGTSILEETDDGQFLN